MPGVSSFELRLWDSRIGRWLSPDPYRQYHSPYIGMGNNPIAKVDPDGGCTNKRGEECVKPIMGGAVTDFAGNEWKVEDGAWSLQTVQQLAPIFIGSMNNDNSIGKFTSGLSLAGTVGLDVFKSAIPNITKNDFLMGRIDPKYVTDFLNNTNTSAMGNLYEKGYKESLKNLADLKRVTKIGGMAFGALDYYSTFENVLNTNYNAAGADAIKSTGSLLSNYVPILGPVVYEGTWYFGDSYLIKQEWYNRVVFGVHSRVYKERGYKYGYNGSKVLDN